MMKGKFFPTLFLVEVFLLYGYASADCLLTELPLYDGSMTVDDYFYVENETMAEDLIIATLTCKEGYTLFGDGKIECVDGEWNTNETFCFENKCSRPPSIKNGTVVIPHEDYENITVGSIAEYSCDAEYELVNLNSSFLECSLNTENRTTFWDGETPVCKKKVECKDPGSSPDGERVGNCCLSNDTLLFTCKDGYELVGEAEIRCLRTGEWSSRRPRCRPLHSEYCEFPDPIPNGLLIGDKEGDYFAPGDKAHILCKPGYKCEENEAVECREGGTWAKEFGVCEEILCSPPPPIPNGKILELEMNNVTRFPYGFEINYVCDEGYRIVVGDSWRMCIKNGIWSGKNTYCEVIRCPDPGTPENGIKSGSDYSVGSRITFRCRSGYELLGAKEILCQANGQWAGKLTRCNSPSNHCPDPGTPMLGHRNKSKFPKGVKVRFGCDPRTIQLGSSIRQCLSDRTWSGSPTKCIEIYDFDNAMNVKERLLTKMADIKEEQRKELEKFEKESLRFRRTIDVNFPGRIMLYFAFDVSGSIPKANFKRSVELAKALVREVDVSAKGVGVGAVTFANEARGIFLPIQYNTIQDVLLALDNIEHTGGGTSATSALSFIRTEYIPLVQSNLKDVNIKSVIFILTDGRANMGGDPKVVAEKLKSEKVEIYCIGITGSTMKKVLYDIATQSTYEEETRANVFMLQDYKTLAWLVQEIVHGTANYSQCGIGKENVGLSPARIVGGKKAIEPWPWMAALYMTPLENKNTKELLCGGSIIHQRYILTAAHCMYTDLSMMRKEEDILVKLGLTNVGETKHLQERDVRKIHVHNHFSLTTYDYDVALLELKEPISFNIFVRPICLPPKEIPKDSQFYKPGSNVWITGWGDMRIIRKVDTRRLMTSKDLKEISLPIQPRETCIESLADDEKFANHFTDRMFCAGTGEGRNDTCKGDSGGPVMMQYLNKQHYACWTQVGIVSWGLGCGLKGEYGMYVQLHKVMPWVNKTICEAEIWGGRGNTFSW